MDSFHAVCPQCQTVNAIRPDRIRDTPVCAKCASTLLPHAPLELSDQTFDKFSTRSGLPLLVDFWAPWCGPCKMMAPAFAEAAESFYGRVLFAKINTQTNERTPAAFRVQSIPTLVLLRHGQEIARQAGAMPVGQIKAWVGQFI